MATGSLYGSVSESTGLYGIGAASGGTYFEWFIFQDAVNAPATPTGGSWSFSTNTGTAPTGWVVSPPPAPVNQVWVSIAVVDSRNSATLTWSVPGLMAASGLPILSASGVPSAGTGLNGQLYINTATTPQGLYFKQSGAWTQLTGSNIVDLVNNQTIGGVKTFTQTIQGDISGNAGNVSGVVAVANGGTGASTAADARTNLGLGTIATQDASAVAITGGSITGITDLTVADGGTGASTASQARTNLGAVGLSDTQTLTNKTISGASNTLTNIPNAALDNDSVNVNGVDLTLGAVQLVGADWVLPDYAGNAGKVLALNPSASDVEWISAGGVGTVTSIDVSGGTTGLTTTGGPITAAGTITLGGTLALASGGTGATTASDARTNLGLGSAAVLTAGAANGVATLDAGGTIPLSQIPASIQGGVSYQGAWNASTNTPTLTSSVGSKGYYYVVSVAGSTDLNGITSWNIGDWAIYNGTAWEKIDNTDAVTSVNGYTGTVILTNTDISGFGTMSTQNANAVAITGGTATLTSLTVNDNTTFGSSNSDTTTFNGRIASEFTPSTANTYDLGRNSHEWRNLYLTGTANISALTASGAVTLSGGTANGVAYLNGSKVLTTGSALTFDGTSLTNTAVSGSSVFQATGKSLVFYNTAVGDALLRAADDASAVTSIGFNKTDVKFYSSGSEQMRLTSTGLGIGTSSPGTKLEVTGDISGTWTSGATRFVGSQFLTGSAYQLGMKTTMDTRETQIFAKAADTGGYVTIATGITPTERVRVDASGSVGIGTSSPSTKLHVNAGASADTDVRLQAGASGNHAKHTYSDSANTVQWTSGYQSSTGYFRISAGNSFNTNGITLDQSGNLGLGVTPSAWASPVKVVELPGGSVQTYSDNQIAINQNFYYNTSDQFIYKTSAAATQYQQIAGTHKWFTAPSGTAGNAISFSQVMTLDANGFLGVGETSPTSRIHVNGTIQARTGATGVQIYGDGGSGYVNSVGTNPLILQVNSTERARLDSAGNLGLGVTPSAWNSGAKTLQIGARSSLYYLDNAGLQYTVTAHNIYNDTSGTDRYLQSGAASQYYQSSGQHVWRIAPSGTAGNAISFTQAMTLDASGNLSVGTTSALLGATGRGNITINGASSAILPLGVNGSFRAYLFTDGTNTELWNSQTGSMIFGTNNAERARIDSSGNLLVGTTSGAFTGKVVTLQTTSASNVITAWNSATSGDNSLIGFFTDGGSGRGSITYNRGAGLVAYNTTSDYRAKDIIGPLTDSGAVIDSVPVYMGKMKGATQERPMFIAHETPEYAHTGEKDAADADGNPVYQQMDASALVPVMWAEIQSLRQRLAAANL